MPDITGEEAVKVQCHKMYNRCKWRILWRKQNIQDQISYFKLSSFFLNWSMSWLYFLLMLTWVFPVLGHFLGDSTFLNASKYLYAPVTLEKVSNEHKCSECKYITLRWSPGTGLVKLSENTLKGFMTCPSTNVTSNRVNVRGQSCSAWFLFELQPSLLFWPTLHVTVNQWQGPGSAQCLSSNYLLPLAVSSVQQWGKMLCVTWCMWQVSDVDVSIR